MDPEINYFIIRKEKATKIFTAQETIYNPYFKIQTVLNSDGFHHLQFSSNRERSGVLGFGGYRR